MIQAQRAEDVIAKGRSPGHTDGGERGLKGRDNPWRYRV